MIKKTLFSPLKARSPLISVFLLKTPALLKSPLFLNSTLALPLLLGPKTAVVVVNNISIVKLIYQFFLKSGLILKNL